MSMDGFVTAFLREMAGLEGLAAFKCVESKFSFALCILQGSIEAPKLWLNMAMQILASVETSRGKEKEWGVILVLEGQKNLTRYAVLGRQTTTGSCPIRRPTWNR